MPRIRWVTAEVFRRRAGLLIGKVLDGGGSGSFSGILQGMEWAAAQDADIVSMSLGSSLPSDGSDPVSQAVETLSADGGPLFVVAAGNEGTPGSIGTPAAAPSALTVGSTTKEGGISSFSSQGPAVTDGGVKPEITAPGSAITAARAAGTLDGAAYSEFYATISGTSMATPHVSGAAAILKQRHPDWDAQQLKAALIGAADPVDGAGVYEQGAGSVDVPGALSSRVTASPAAVSAELTWPYAGNPTRTVTYRNSGSKDIRLNLSLTGNAPVPLVTRRLTVPAGTTAEATVRIDTARASAGAHSAWITARGGDGSTARTPVGVEAEAQSATLTPRPRPCGPGSRRRTPTWWCRTSGPASPSWSASPRGPRNCGCRSATTGCSAGCGSTSGTAGRACPRRPSPSPGASPSPATGR